LRNAEEKIDLKDEIAWLKFAEIDWCSDNKGFYYNTNVRP